jgi:hypothetical protein
MREKFFRRATIFLFFLCLAYPLFPQRSKKITWGVYGGWSWGTGYAFRWHYRPYSDRYVPQFHLGGYVQFNLSQSFGLQGDVNYQNLLNEWTFHHPSFPHDSGEDSLGFSSLSLKGIYSLPKWDSVQLYIAAGGGIDLGEWYEFGGIYFHLVGNPGIKLFLSKSNPSLVLNLGGSFIYLFDIERWAGGDAFYIRLNFGIEF